MLMCATQTQALLAITSVTRCKPVVVLCDEQIREGVMRAGQWLELYGLENTNL